MVLPRRIELRLSVFQTNVTHQNYTKAAQKLLKSTSMLLFMVPLFYGSAVQCIAGAARIELAPCDSKSHILPLDDTPEWGC